MVTNDKFRDYIDGLHQALIVEEIPSSKKKGKKKPEVPIIDKSAISKEQKWIKAHSVSYTFNKDEFLPNPDSKLWL